MIPSFIRRRILPVLVPFLCGVGPAAAHPHVFVDGQEGLVFGKHSHIVAITHVWTFDAPFSAFATQGLDKNGDGKLTTTELAPLAQTNMDSLAYYGFFTSLIIKGTAVALASPQDYYLTMKNGRLTLHYTLPLKTPQSPLGKIELKVFDPEYFVAYDFSNHTKLVLKDAPATCRPSFSPPHKLDDAIMARIAAVPADQHDLPETLSRATDPLASRFYVECP